LTAPEFEKFSAELSESVASAAKAQPKKVASLIDNKLASVDENSMIVSANLENISSNRISRNVTPVIK